MKSLSIDLEVFSSVNLSKSGCYRYVESPDFDILLFGYCVDGGEVQVIDLASGEKIPATIVAALTDKAVTKWAFNAQFERICLSRYLGFPVGEYSTQLRGAARWYGRRRWACRFLLKASARCSS
jgi:DNA polymerase